MRLRALCQPLHLLYRVGTPKQHHPVLICGRFTLQVPELVPVSPGGGGKATPPSKMKKPIPDKDSDEYRQRRERNNLAVKKSRMRSKQKAQDTQQRVNELKEENERLEAKIKLLSKELSVLKDLFLEHAHNLADNVQPPAVAVAPGDLCTNGNNSSSGSNNNNSSQWSERASSRLVKEGLLALVGQCYWLQPRVGEGHWLATEFWLPGPSILGMNSYQRQTTVMAAPQTLNFHICIGVSMSKLKTNKLQRGLVPGDVSGAAVEAARSPGLKSPLCAVRRIYTAYLVLLKLYLGESCTTDEKAMFEKLGVVIMPSQHQAKLSSGRMAFRLCGREPGGPMCNKGSKLISDLT
ncbi:hypothetical protein P4O66_004382 [Electrophorus voltai]|uniref:CCAAT/enhancer-binding protein gamma n=1 Tax=Electrophorus voltai TaxID=2609070 RepID=A0AAD9E2K3_9TELE|nr:hypothetical protein P4O66_004382 [Electrophorus voltai]